MTDLVLTPTEPGEAPKSLTQCIRDYVDANPYFDIHMSQGNPIDEATEYLTRFLAGTKLAPALDGEPIFVLRAQDKIAPSLVLAWANDAARHDVNAPKSVGAMQIAHEMIAWQMANPSRVKLPD